ncbi:MAG: mechanosensitive ion channel domain-containing protein [Luteolibacter sp.]
MKSRWDYLRTTRACAVACVAFSIATADAAESDATASMMADLHRDTQIELARANDPAAVDLLPEGVRPSSLTIRRQNLEQTLLAIGRFEKATASQPDLKRAMELAEEADKAWLRFDEPPPYSILKLDQLQNQRDALTGKITSLESSLDIMRRAEENLLTEAQSAGENLRRRNAEAERGGDDAQWRLQSAQIQSRQIDARKAALGATITGIQLQLKAAISELSLLDRQIRAVENNIVFSDEDFESIIEASKQRQKALRGELAAIHKRQRAASVARDRAITARDKALAAREADAPPSDALSLAIARAETAESAGESMQLIAEAIEWLLQIEAYHLAAQEDRRILMTSGHRAERTAAEAAIRMIIDRLRAWEIVTGNEINSVAADLTRVEAAIAALAEDDPRLALRKEQQAILLERQSAVQRVVRAVSAQSNQLGRWVTTYEMRKRTLGERAADYSFSAIGHFHSFLGIEVFTYEDGERGHRGVTLGDMLTALLLFIIPYLIVHFIVRRIKRTTVSMKLIGEAQANTLGNWLTILVAFPLALIALNFLKIPLTIFAFLGGALVIGLGFGMQTIIKNFISGIIILFERRVRVGDIVDVEGTLGTVTEINTRSSVIRSPDGVETMVPNSLFLENRVTSLTLTNRCNRRMIRVGVAYGSEPPAVMEALRECVDRHGLVLKDPEPMVLFEDFGDSALIFAVYFWVEFNERTNALQVMSDLRIMIEKRLGELGIAIPFPQRDLHFSSDRPVTVRLARKNDQPTPTE